MKELNSSHLQSSFELFMEKLKCAYWSEKQLLKLLPRLAKASSTRYLKASFKGHFNATSDHLKRLELIFQLLNEKNSAKRCTQMDELISESVNKIKSTDKNTRSRDLSLIGVAKKIALFEIDGYNRLINTSNELGNFELTLLLEETLIEEQEAEETFQAVREDTLKDEMFEDSTTLHLIPEEIDELEAAM